MKIHERKIPKIAVEITEVLTFATSPDVKEKMMVTISRKSRVTPVQKRYLSL